MTEHTVQNIETSLMKLINNYYQFSLGFGYSRLTLVMLFWEASNIFPTPTDQKWKIWLDLWI